MPTTYVVNAYGRGIQLTGSDGAVHYFSLPVITAAATSVPLAYRDARPNLIEFRQDDQYLVVPIADITQVGAEPAANTLSAVFDQILGLLPEEGVSDVPLYLTEVASVASLPASVSRPRLYFISDAEDAYLLVGSSKFVLARIDPTAP